ncbi:LPS-assembly lipoprotein [Dyella jiangningensis]|uniref:LPS-assembly lipoprotein LptE n=1 Tax=Dyella sp. AtDHG13 TaxID=1938897 RepID=UPI000883F7AD|nr:LPS assembly lipoprotein LptE [Dyella sp. AtDHG13]PXV58361.1 LPS-assembly lipoprotein [Dyella sp. AtDHG13]SDK05566.1 LPS-assembly lipoprotein [Dyella jiangningensis]
MSRVFKASLLLMSTLTLAACGFHLRQNVALPPAMQHVHVVTGNLNLQRGLERSLVASGINVEDHKAPDIAELNIPVAQFTTDTLTINGAARVTEYTVRYQVQFEVHDGTGQPLIPRQRIDLQRDFSYDPTNTIGTAAQVDAIQSSLNDDMITAILLRLQAAGRHPGQTAAAAAAQEAQPAPASSSSTH